MSDHQRDFYRIQDRLLMAWRFAEAEAVNDSELVLRTLDRELEEVLLELHDESPATTKALTLLNRKIDFLISSVQGSSDKPTNLGGFCDKALVDVSLSGSGMGYFSVINAEEGSYVEVILNLESIDVEITVRMVIIESRISADSENPGFWLRGRFTEDQDKQVDAVVAHVNQRQFEQLKRRAKATGTQEENSAED